MDMSYNYRLGASTTFRNNYLGSKPTGTAFANGYMDEFRLYNATLTDADVSSLYNYVTNTSTMISATTGNNAWSSLSLQGMRGYTNWQLGDAYGYVDASSNYRGLVGFYNQSASSEKKITKINNLSYLQNTKKLSLIPIGGVDFSANPAGFTALNQSLTNRTFLQVADFAETPLGYTIHTRFSVDTDCPSNAGILTLQSGTILKNGRFDSPAVARSSATLYTGSQIPNWNITYVPSVSGIYIGNTVENMFQTSLTCGIYPYFPYPMDCNQCAIIMSSYANQASLSQTFYCEPGTYNLLFYATGSQYSGTIYDNNILVYMDNSLILDVSSGMISYKYWAFFTQSFTITTIGYHTLSFVGIGQGLGNINQKSLTAISNVNIVNAGSVPSFNNPSFETPVIANDSSMNITSAISGGWNVTGTVSVLNNFALFAASTNQPLFRSYANGNQCVALIGVSSIGVCRPTISDRSGQNTA